MNNHPSSDSQQAAQQNSFLDHRIHPRTILSSTVSVFNQETKEYIGLLVDVSESGLMLSSYQPLNNGEILNVDIVEIPKDKAQRVTGKLKIEIVWSQMVNSSMHGNGCHIIEQDVAAENMLKSYQVV